MCDFEVTKLYDLITCFFLYSNPLQWRYTKPKKIAFKAYIKALNNGGCFFASIPFDKNYIAIVCLQSTASIHENSKLSFGFHLGINRVKGENKR